MNTTIRNRPENVHFLGSVIAGGGLLIALLMLGVSVASDARVTMPLENYGSVTENPDAYYGKQVSLIGDVDVVMGTRAFVMHGAGMVGQDVLVVSKNPLIPVGGAPDGDNMLVNPQDKVEVLGSVQRLDIAAFEEQIGMDLPDEAFIAWAGKPAVIADSVNTRSQ